MKKTIEEKPEDRTHWSTRSMAKAVGVGKTTVGKVWKAHRLKPHLEKTFKLSHDKHHCETERCHRKVHESS